MFGLYSRVEVSIVAEWALYSNHAGGSEKENNNASELRTEDVFLGGGGRGDPHVGGLKVNCPSLIRF